MPRDIRGNDIQTLEPSRYRFEDLMKHSEERGLIGLPCADKPNQDSFWRAWATSGDCPTVLVSRTGMVALQFKGEIDWRVLAQQWSYQGPTITAQKYLEVWFADNPHYPRDSNPHLLHRLVGRTHPNYTEDAVYVDGDGFWRLKSGVQIDHLDKNKGNNCADNLFWVSKEKNKQMVSWETEIKQSEIRSWALIDESLIRQ